jgi:hypothetical protein
MKYIALISVLFIGLAAAVYYPIQHDGSLSGDGTVEFPLGLNSYTISPSQLTSHQNNYAPAGIGRATTINLSSDNGMQSITGIADTTAGPLTRVINNVGTYAIVLLMDHPSSDADHRFTGQSQPFFLPGGHSCTLIRDVSNSRWRVIGMQNFMPTVYYHFSAGSSSVGDYGNVTLGNLAGSGTGTATDATTTLPAALQFSTSTVTTGRFCIAASKTINNISAFGAAHTFVEAVISIPTLSDGTETFTVELQITNAPNTAAVEVNNSVNLRYSHSINSGEWEFFSQDNAGAESTPIDCNVAVATGTPYKLRLDIDKTKTEALVHINGAYIGRVTTNLPNSVVCGARLLIFKSAGSTARAINVHSFTAGAIYPL